MRTVTVKKMQHGDIELAECQNGGFILEETDDIGCRHRLSRRFKTAFAALRNLESGRCNWGVWSSLLVLGHIGFGAVRHTAIVIWAII